MAKSVQAGDASKPVRELTNAKESYSSKKRKIKDASGDGLGVNLTKENPKEKKRLRRGANPQNDRTAPAPDEEQVELLRSDVPEARPDDKKGRKAKEARRAEKRRSKKPKEIGAHEGGSTVAETMSISIVAQGHNPERVRGTVDADGESASGYLEDPNLKALPEAEIKSFLAENHITITDASTGSHLRPILSFAHLPASAAIQPSPFASFKKPTPIQAAAWPFLLSGRDVVGVAETGSGKTLAFGVPCVQHIALLPTDNKKGKRGPARAVILSPTRELAIQTYEQILLVAKPAHLEAVCVFGGVPKDAQRLALKTAHIVVATPGRLNDLIEEQSADLSNVSYVVLDEADRMLDKGFEQEIRRIISATLPRASAVSSPTHGRRRQVLMFTATWPPSIRELASTFMHNPVRINIGADNPMGELRANDRIKQVVEVVDPHSKEQRLLQLVKQHQSGKNAKDKILVFCLYRKEAVRIENLLRQRGLNVAGIHGDLTQERRTKSLEKFKSGETPLLVATDVAARGLDIPNVKVVLNVTFPLTVEDYVHRIGRTGRAGADGLAITLFTEYDKGQSGALINVLRAASQPIPEELMKFGTTVKKKHHDTYGAFYKADTGRKAEKIKFDD